MKFSFRQDLNEIERKNDVREVARKGNECDW